MPLSLRIYCRVVLSLVGLSFVFIATKCRTLNRGNEELVSCTFEVLSLQSFTHLSTNEKFITRHGSSLVRLDSYIREYEEGLVVETWHVLVLGLSIFMFEKSKRGHD